MKVLFLTEYFYPYVHGGAEVSIFQLGRSLVKSGQQVSILTPNYGTRNKEMIEGIKVFRYPFLKKLKNYSDQLTPFWYSNPFFFFLLTIQIIKTVRREKMQVIHCQSLYSLPAAAVAGKILGLPTIVTFRDSQILCNYGWCLSQNQYGTTCSLKEYFTRDFKKYYQKRVSNKNLAIFLLQLCLAINGRIRTTILKFFARLIPNKITCSYSQQKIFKVNGIGNTEVIYNLYAFPDKLNKPKPIGECILYATKLSPGKGLDILLPAFARVLAVFPKARLLIVGGGEKNKYLQLSYDLGLGRKVEFSPRVTSEEVMNIRQKVLLEVAPSIYPESFGRVALEALASGIPAVVSNRGGLKEIITDGITGYITAPEEKALAEAIIKGIRNNGKLRANIAANYQSLKQKFGISPVEKHLSLYQSLL